MNEEKPVSKLGLVPVGSIGVIALTILLGFLTKSFGYPTEHIDIVGKNYTYLITALTWIGKGILIGVAIWGIKMPMNILKAANRLALISIFLNILAPWFRPFLGQFVVFLLNGYLYGLPSVFYLSALIRLIKDRTSDKCDFPQINVIFVNSAIGFFLSFNLMILTMVSTELIRKSLSFSI